MTTATITDRFTLRRTPGRRWELLDGDTVVETFTRRADADRELEASIADATGACPSDPDGIHSSDCGCDAEQGRDVSGVNNQATPEVAAEITGAIAAAVIADPASFAGVLTPENIAAMDPATRQAFARAELEVIRGLLPKRMDFTVLDWLTDPANLGIVSRRPKAAGSRAVPRSAEDETQLREAIVAARGGGATWHGVGKALHAAGIDTPRGGRWYAVTVRETAKRLGVYDGTDGVLTTE